MSDTNTPADAGKDASGSAIDNAARLVGELRVAIAESQRELKNMPALVRPMVRRGFARRTGLSFDDWDRTMADLLRRLDSGATSSNQLLAGRLDLVALLERLADNYRTAPERAARFMRNEDTLQRVRASSAAREQAARALVDCLRALPE